MGFARNNLKSRAGFTLVELLAVVSIIGSLAVIALPQFQEYRQRVYDTAAMQELANFIVAANDVDPNNSPTFSSWQPTGRHPVFTAVSVSPNVKMWLWSYDFGGIGAGLLGYSCHVNGVTGYALFVPYTTNNINWWLSPNEIDESAAYRWVCV